jgi:hemerythrin-like domain-containing protein
MLKALSALQPRIEKGEVDPDTLTSVVDFFRTYADKFHHAKEEAQFFPTLEKRGVKPKGCPIGVLHSEHEQGRSLVSSLNDAIQKSRQADATANAAVGSLIKNMIGFYTDHIWKEDYLLFPMSKKVLTESDQTELQQGFAKVDAEMGDEFESKYRHVVECLEKIAKKG